MNKKGVELPINTLIIIIIAIVALVIILFIFSETARQFAANIFARLRQAFGMWPNETAPTALP